MSWRYSRTAASSLSNRRYIPLLRQFRRVSNISTVHSIRETGRTRSRILRVAIWSVPALGICFYIAKTRASGFDLESTIAAPSLIPPQQRESQAFNHVATSPIEPGFLSTILSLLRRRILSPLRTGLRFLHLVFIFTPVLVLFPMVFVGDADPKSGKERWGAIWWYDLLTRQMQSAGPTFIKLSQWASSRRDLFSIALCERLGSLQATTKPHSIHHTIQVVEEAFGRPFEEIFESFDDQPIGSGAIAQAYRATLRRDLLPPTYLEAKRTVANRFPTPLNPSASLPAPVPSASVAVKVLHPGVNDMIRRDLSIMNFFAKFLSLFSGMQWLSLGQEVQVFGRMMNEQVDLRHEARNLVKFEKNFKARHSAVAFPRPLEDYSTSQLLIEEFQDAVPLRVFLQRGGGPYDAQIATLGLDSFLNMLLIDNFIHADLHPGNILVKFYKPTTRFVLQSIAASIFNTTSPVDPVHTTEADDVVRTLLSLQNGKRADWDAALKNLVKQGYQPELVILDAGLVTSLDDTNRRNFLDLFRAIATFDGYTAGKLMVQRCRSPEMAIDPETFALKMQHLVLSVKAKTFSLGQIRISDVLTTVLRNVREHHVKMEGDFVNTIIGVLLLEGIGRQLDPDLDLFKSALPILRQLGRQVTAKDAIADMPTGDIGAMVKFWVWLEARSLISSALVNVDELIQQDWLCPNI